MQLYFGFGLKILFWDLVTTRLDVAVSVGSEGGTVGGCIGWLAAWSGGDGMGEVLTDGGGEGFADIGGEGVADADRGGEGVGVGEINGTCCIGKDKSVVVIL